MLVLSRQRDETIMIGDEVELTVVDIRGDKVRIGIKAPSHVAVHRKEVYDAIRNENQQAAGFRGELGAYRPRGLNAGNRLAAGVPQAKPAGGSVLPTAARISARTPTHLPESRRETA